MSTLIKRLYQNNNEFVPITLSEAVVVNTTNINELKTLGITTLDKVLRTTLNLVGTNTSTLNTLNEAVSTINSTLENKQDKLTAGAGINISDTGVISATLGFELYKIVTRLPDPSEDVQNTIYIVQSSASAGNLFSEFICVLNPISKKYEWEEIGTIAADVDLSGYVTNETFNQAIASINTALSNTISAVDVTLSDNTTKVAVTYDIPSNLYDSAVRTDQQDDITVG